MAIFFGVILLTSTVVIALPGLMTPLESTPGVTITNTPADNYPDAQRAQFCGTGDAKSTPYIKEYKIPTDCTNPMAITTDFDGTVWFAQSNTGNVAKFNPLTESFTEFENPLWPEGESSMMWGMDHSPDGTIWFTDGSFDAIWKFSPFEESYGLLEYPAGEIDALLQKIQIFGADLIINDFTGGNLVVLTPLENDAQLFVIPPVLPDSVTSDFATDDQKNIWFTSWTFPDAGVLAKFDYASYSDESADFSVLGDFVTIVELPSEATTINGVAYADENIWLADTSSSYFFSFDPATSQFTKFVTSAPDQSTYGNATGIVKSPVSRPYWIAATDEGNVVFNEQMGNRIAVFDPREGSLVEYSIPSKNSNWADCGDMVDCGIAQVFDFTIHEEKIWFTEWVENNIGVLDTSIALPFAIHLDFGLVSVAPGGTANITLTVFPEAEQDLSGIDMVIASSDENLTITADSEFQIEPDGTRVATFTIQTDDELTAGQYKVLLGAQTGDVSIGKFLTIVI